MNLFGENVVYDDDEPVVEEEMLAPPQSMAFCLGHNAQEQLFLDLFNKDNIPHAVIFSGLEGIGKSTMAFRLARFLLKHGQENDQDNLFGAPEPPQTMDVTPDDPVFTRVASGGHADLLTIQRHYDSTKDKLDATLKVDALRKIEPFLRKTSSAGGWRVVIVDDADTMNRSAQNAILKILEEPPPRVLIILIAHRPGMLIPTIRSRARVIPFAPLSQDHMNELLRKQGHALSPEDLDILSALSEGSIGTALRMVEEGGLDMFSTVLDHLDDAPQWNWIKIHTLANSLGTASKDKDYRMFTALLQWVFRKLLFIKARGIQDLPAYLQRESLQNIMTHYPLEKLIAVNDGLKTHFDRTEFSNLDRRDAVRAAFLVISQES